MLRFLTRSVLLGGLKLKNNMERQTDWTEGHLAPPGAPLDLHRASSSPNERRRSC